MWPRAVDEGNTRPHAANRTENAGEIHGNILKAAVFLKNTILSKIKSKQSPKNRGMCCGQMVLLQLRFPPIASTLQEL